jgi:tetratricopeptide (TPR) repeat protein
MKDTSDTSALNQSHWLDIAEKIAVLGAISGSVASVFLKQFLWVTIPLSASATFTLLNHQRLKNLIHKEQAEIATSVQKHEEVIAIVKAKSQERYQENKTNIIQLDSDLAQVRNLATSELARIQKEETENFNFTSKELHGLQTSLAHLDNLSQKLEQDLDNVDKKQKETGKLVRELKAIDIFTQNIKINLNTVQSYFERGFAYQRLGNKHRAIEDYSKTIELSSNHAQAYHNRGLLYVELGINQKAIIDLRKASQLYFDKGNLEKYRETRDLSQNIHQQNNVSEVTLEQEEKINVPEQVIVKNLFN